MQDIVAVSSAPQPCQQPAASTSEVELHGLDCAPGVPPGHPETCAIINPRLRQYADEIEQVRIA
ncbi:hypothetical protein TUSST3_39800 [Streptomyces sp. TUS-ST3]|nr:hypothetical protein TUSST3_39800 [Streptomyces sp. TUS-ST3]